MPVSGAERTFRKMRLFVRNADMNCRVPVQPAEICFHIKTPDFVRLAENRYVAIVLSATRKSAGCKIFARNAEKSWKAVSKGKHKL